MIILSPSVEGQKTLEKINQQPLLPLFDMVILEFIQELSLRCIKLKAFPEVVALGFWLRKANIHALEQQWKTENSNRLIKPRGTVFHIAPSNVDTIFVYSWILSLLTGNRNIIRLSSKVNIQSNVLLSDIVALLKEQKYEGLAQRNILLTYNHDDKITEKISGYCHVRVVWGGDHTVEQVRRIPLPPMATELAFADRYSLALIKAQAFIEQDELAQLKVVQQFYNDAYWFDQLACSSPKLIVWQGKREQVEAVQTIFWTLLEQIYEEKMVEPVPALQVQKLATGLLLAVDDNSISFNHQQAYSSIRLHEINMQVRERHCGGGFFGECVITSSSELAEMVTDKDQTVSYFGYDKEELILLADQITSRGIDRIVPIGMALDFQDVWDGQQFMKSFTREVVIR